jgi:aryl-alcohol dehydrogenase-like predicted oxidoreductase
MKYQLLGNSGLRVSELCLGAMTFGEEWGWGSSKDESHRIFNSYVDVGGNFIDTANKYTEGTSEKYIGEFISGDRDRFVLATKYTSNTRRGDPNAGGNQRKNLMQSLDASLKRLNTDYIDLYWVHAWDPLTPIEETLRALDDMVRAGKILYIGISDAPAWIVSKANTIANLRGWTEFTGIQIEYSLIERTSERELLPMANAFNIGVTAWSPLGGGVLTGKYNKTNNEQQQPQYKQQQQQNASISSSSSNSPITKEGGTSRRLEDQNELTNRFLNDRNLLIAQEVSKIAKEIRVGSSQVALNWIRQRNILESHGKNKIIPIIGARNESQIKDNLACLEFELTEEQMKILNEVSKIEMGFPQDFLNSEAIKDVVYGGTYSLIHNTAGIIR